MSEETELDIKAAFGVLRRIEDKLPPGFSILGGEETIVIEALTQHSGHFEAHPQINPKRFEPFKLICWVAGTLLDGLEKDDGGRNQGLEIIKAVIRVLQEAFLLETKVLLPVADEVLIEAFVLEEFFGNASNGVGRNGLYLAFHCARSVLLLPRL